MSKPRYRWWGFVRRMIRDYPSLKKDLADLHSQSVTADYSGMPKGGGTGRGVESIALKQLPPDDQQVYDAVTRAVTVTQLRPDGKERMALITMMYWSKKCLTAKASASCLHIAEITAKRWHGDFVTLVAKCYGFNVDTPEPNKRAKIVKSKKEET